MKTDWTSFEGDKERVYEIAGETFPAVTTILKPFTDFTFAHVRWIESYVDELSAMWRENRTVPIWYETDGEWQKVESDPIEALTNGKMISRHGFRMMKRKQECGTLRHYLLESYAKGIQLEANELEEWVSETIMDMGLGIDVCDAMPTCKPVYDHLWRWKPTIIATEALVINRIFKYAGTLDAIARYDNHPKFKEGIIDLKPEANRKYVAQLAAYREGTHIVVDGEEVPMVRFPNAALLQVEDYKCGLRVVGDKELTTYFDGIFKPLCEAWHGQKVPLPKEKCKWD